ncbi:MAG TPA: DUF547 domain-containing protein [Gammaproteobacteria bacterium]|nr:DUF547 domain-containing protein [Gammaproteobacteria bacterium]
MLGLRLASLGGAAFWLLGLISTATPVPTIATDAADIDNATWFARWTSVLERHVDGAGRIDFAELRDNHDELDRVVGFIAAVDPASRPDRFPTHEDKLAYYINAYNALAMYGVLKAGVPDSLGGLRKIGFFYLRTFTVGGRSISLYDLENDVIRPMGDSRIHFALNCMVVSCPRLPRHAFTPGEMDRQLDEATREFVADSRNVRVDPERRDVWLSAIFDFYTKDFLAAAKSLVDYVNRYRTEKVPDGFEVRFSDYDWTVNAQTRGRTQAQ